MTVFSFFSSPVSQAKENIPQFCEVAAGFYRGGQPTDEGLKELKAKGIKTVINFRHEEDLIEEERQKVEALGMEYISIPWTIYGEPDPKVLEDFLKVSGDEAKKPVFMHCRRGVERTGVMNAVYAMAYTGLSPEAAYAKAFEGFPLKWYWKMFVNRQVDFFEQILNERGGPQT